MSNARWQRWMVFVNLALTVAWIAWQWPRSPGWALGGPVLALLGFRMLMGLQFVLMARANRADPSPAPSGGQMLRAWWAESGWATRVFGWWQPFRRGAIADWLPERSGGAQGPAPRGVVLVHGFLCNRGFWTPWLPLLRERGHAFVAVDLEPPFGSIDDYAATIDAAVRRVTEATGRAPVVIGHSMGGIAARAWLRACDAGRAEACAHRVITLGSPHGGTWAGRFSNAVNGRQMALEGEWVQALRRAEPPGRAARFTCFYSSCDNIVFPARTATLPGADNRFVPGVAHVQMAFHPAVMQACLELLAD
ncbi:triacylglycerol lipase [Acidovorax sp. Leaf160]|uniref:esterase/lipase family protein n=1 Tax=Acidovorax sp. Leaf160 TaxID=1736280 RepID=UPI0006F6838D|nr:alpha/beta fold hydrolase [Acidovorax sp. Leaf160]KQR41429.1 permease [Acidovorax sp. Leaf160]